MIAACLLYSTMAATGQQTETDSADRVYRLGQVEVQGDIPDQLHTVSRDQLDMQGAQDVANAVGFLPGLHLQKVGSKNELMLTIRGFDLRHTPLLYDGIPVYQPYDGYFDLSRMGTAGISRIRLSKSYSSIMLGPNALGGAVNVISSQPQPGISLNLEAGYCTEKAHYQRLGFGLATEKYYLQLDLSNYWQSYYPMAKTPDSDLEDNRIRNNSHQYARKIHLKAGYRPAMGQHFSLNYTFTDGEKGNPLYLGSKPWERPRYWQWPRWDVHSIYVIADNRLGDKLKLKSRVFNDKFDNRLEAYDDGSYSSQGGKFAYTSVYDDHSAGASTQLTFIGIEGHSLSAIAYYKSDYHQENDGATDIAKYTDNTIYIGIEDKWYLGDKITFIPGLGYNTRQSQGGEMYDTHDDTTITFAPDANSGLDMQTAFRWELSKTVTLRSSLSWKHRMPTLKDRYSFRLGRALPSPGMKPEQALNNDLGLYWQTDHWLEPKLSIEGYWSELSDVIMRVDSVEAGLYQYRNAGTAQAYGAELMASIKPTELLGAALGYAWTKRENLNHPELFFTDLPEHKLSSWIKWQVINHLSIYISGQYITERYSTSDGEYTAPEFFLMDTYIEYELPYDIRLRVGADNVLNRNYYLAEGYPEAGRQYFIKLNYHFERSGK